MRVTMGSIMRNYNSRLSNSLGALSRASQRALTGRRFEKAAEDPSSAVRLIQLRRQHSQNENYLNNLRDTQGLFEVAETVMTNISRSAESVYVSVLSALNGDKSVDERTVLAQQLRTIQETMVMDANTAYGDAYMFGGSSTKELPFRLDENGRLFFRGIDVETADPGEQALLQKMADEKIYVDFGFGLKFEASPPADPNTLVSGSAFNTSLPGINFLGFGKDADGFSNNIILAIGKLAAELEKNPMNSDTVRSLSQKFDTQRKSLLVNITEMGTNSIFMDFTANRLESSQYNLELRMSETEFVDTALAYTEYEMQKYAYDAALKIGGTILTRSLIDFMS